MLSYANRSHSTRVARYLPFAAFWSPMFAKGTKEGLSASDQKWRQVKNVIRVTFHEHTEMGKQFLRVFGLAAGTAPWSASR
jgi:hypothetical protein